MRAEALKALTVKELKDLLRDPRIIIPFALSAVVLPAMALVMLAAGQQAVKQVVEAKLVAVADLDRSTASSQLVQWLEGRGFKVVEVAAKGNDTLELASRAAREGASALLVVNPGFERALLSRERPVLQLISLVKEVSLFSFAGGAAVADVVKEFAASKLLEPSGLSYELVKDPVSVQTLAYVAPRNTLVNPALLPGLAMAALIIPLILMSVTLVVMQMAATSMAVENEERTLETLLTLPVSRFEILLAKLLGMFGVSLLGTAFEVAGMLVYFYLLTLFTAALAQAGPGQAPPLIQVAPVPPSDLAYLGASLLVALFFAAALGLIIGALSKDVRTANTIVGPISMIVYLPAMLVVFIPSEALGPVGTALLYLLPPLQPVIAAKDAISSGLPPAAPAYLAASLALTLAAVYVTSKIFSLETLSNLQYKISQLVARRQGGGGGR